MRETTDTTPRAVLTERWRAILTDVKQFADEPHPTPVLSERDVRLREILAELAILMVSPVDDEPAGLDDVVSDIVQSIRLRLYQFVEDLEAEPELARKAVAS